MKKRGSRKGRPNKRTIALATDGVSITKLAQSYAPKAIEVLAKLMDHPDADVRARAANSLLDRGLGKPAQSVMLQGDENKPIEHKVRVEFI